MIKNGIEIGAKIAGLKACPFCDSEAYLNEAHHINGNILYHVHCPVCNLRTRYAECDINNVNTVDAIAKCIEIWNLRCEDDNTVNKPVKGEVTVKIRRVRNE